MFHHILRALTDWIQDKIYDDHTNHWDVVVLKVISLRLQSIDVPRPAPASALRDPPQARVSRLSGTEDLCPRREPRRWTGSVQSICAICGQIRRTVEHLARCGGRPLVIDRIRDDLVPAAP